MGEDSSPLFLSIEKVQTDGFPTHLSALSLCFERFAQPRLGEQGVTLEGSFGRLVLPFQWRYDVVERLKVGCINRFRLIIGTHIDRADRTSLVFRRHCDVHFEGSSEEDTMRNRV